MKTWIVFVKVSWAGSICVRYIDSQWAAHGSAKDRVTELEKSIAAFGRLGTDSGGTVSIVEGVIADAKLTEETQCLTTGP